LPVLSVQQLLPVFSLASLPNRDIIDNTDISQKPRLFTRSGFFIFFLKKNGVFSKQNMTLFV
jgi:hypothetical protein